MSLRKRVLCEFLGTAYLLAAVVGSGIMGQALSPGSPGLALLANALATAGALITLILVCAPISGAHLNPAVTLVLCARGDYAWKDAGPYVLAQIFGGCVGVLSAHAMFALPILQTSSQVRSGSGQSLAEFIATAGLLITILTLSRSRPKAMPYAVASYILAAYWFTASTSFANPAVTLARSLTDSFSGIDPASVAAFLAAQLLAVLAVIGGMRWLSEPFVTKPVGSHRI